MRIFYVSAGAADIISAHKSWSVGEDDPSQVSITFSSQIADFVKSMNAKALFLSFGRKKEFFRDDRFILEHKPFRKYHGIIYYLFEVVKTFHAIIIAIRFKSDVALIDSGSLSWFTLVLFDIARIPVIPILHNVLWPAGFPPRGLKARVKAAIDLPFWKLSKRVALGVSEEACRQIEAVSGARRASILRFVPQFRRCFFNSIPSVPPRDGPFNVLFVGRAVREKGLLMLPEIALSVERRKPGAVRWTVCGDGPDLPELRAAIAAHQLDDLFEIRGWTSPVEMASVYSEIHAVIVPTTSTFCEGLAMTAVEAVLAGRPLVTNPVVPALEDLRDGALVAIPDDAESHADAVLSLVDKPNMYKQLQAALPGLSSPFYDKSRGLTAILTQAISQNIRYF
jgi:glycogen synthase